MRKSWGTYGSGLIIVAMVALMRACFLAGSATAKAPRDRETKIASEVPGRITTIRREEGAIM
jgi:hypothetical protein